MTTTTERTYIPVRLPAEALNTGLPFETGRPASSRVIYDQIGTGNLMACGARDFVHDEPNGLLQFRVGPGGEANVRKVYVRLMADDTYSVEYGYLPMSVGATERGTWGMWHPVEREDGVYAESLGAVVRRLGDRG